MTNTMEPKPRAWQRMLSGRRLDLLDPAPSDVEIEDIAHGLARVARWNGQTLGPHAFSVAQHSVLVEDIARALYPEWNAQERLAALLHDAAEYVIGDLISPFKAALGFDYKAFEIRLMEAIHARFDLAPQLSAGIETGIKQADRVAAYYEATRLAGFSADEARQFFGTPSAIPVSLSQALYELRPLATGEAQNLFLTRFGELAHSKDDGLARKL